MLIDNTILNSFIKEADNLKPHQQRVIDKLHKQDAMLVYHATGSGKTMLGLSAANQLGMQATVIGPASLRNNFKKEKYKHHITANVKSYTYNKPPENVTPKELLIFDEAQRMGNLNTQRSHLVDTLHGGKTMLLSATPIKNSPSDIIPIARGLGINFPRDKEGFNKQFIENKTVKPGQVLFTNKADID